jgi:hypothetical protein
MLRALLCGLTLSLLSVALHAAPIDFSILNPNIIGAPGGSFTFQGTITNNSGFDLQSTDFFFNFYGFDPLNVTLTQLLGNTVFGLPNGQTTGVVDLFQFDLAPTAGPGVYPAIVVLQDSVGDITDPQTVTVTVIPEPGSFVLMGTGLLGILASGWRRHGKWLLLIFGGILSAQLTVAQVSKVKFVTNIPGLATANTTVMTSTPISNRGTVAATNVKVTSATLKNIPASGSFPIVLGTMPPGKTIAVQTNFHSASLLANTKYLLTIRGTYQVGGETAGFALNRYITTPVASPGSNTVNIGSAPPFTVTGAPFPPRPPDMGNEVNFPRSPIPTGPFVAGTPTPTGTGAMSFPGLKPKQPLQFNSVVFGLNNSLGITNAGTNCSPGTPPASCAEPSGADAGNGIVFVTANWTAAYSTNGGNTFTPINPTTIFPNDTIGFCCDQQVQYVPSIDRFIWVLQGPGGMRLASASPAAVQNSGGTSWTYWNLDVGTFGQPSGTGFDYPDTSVGDNNLYLSWDVGFPACPQGCTSGFEVVRIPLSQIQAGGTIFFDYTHPGDSGQAWGSHLTQDTSNEVFWAGHNGNSTLRVWSLAEGSNTYFWRDVGISSWANNTLSAPTPDKNDFFAFGFPGSSVIGATRSGNQLWFGWSAGTDNNFQQDHVELVTLDRGNNFNKIQQVQVWNNSYAFGYPSLATNLCTGEIGMSLVYGGNGNYENHVVGFWGDFAVYITTNSGSGVNRYGDYLTIRQDGFANFSAMGYGISTVNSSMQSDVRWVVFGRNCD